MPDPALPRLDPERRERLAALGLELLALRTELAAPLAAVPPASPRLVLTGVAWPSSATLLLGIVAALGLRADEVAAGPSPGRPALHFGPGYEGEDMSLPPLEALGSAQAKRALWPGLRRLRRRLDAERSG